MVEFMGKVLVTLEQMDRISKLLGNGHGKEWILRQHKKGWKMEYNVCLNNLSYEEMAKILDNRSVCLVATPELIDFHRQGEKMNEWKSETQSKTSDFFERKLNNLIEGGDEMEESKFEPADIPMSIEEYNRQEELKAKARQEESMKSLQETMQEGINAIKQLVSVLGEKVHKNIQANVNFKPEINYNPETLDIDNFVKEVKKQIDKGFFHAGEESPTQANDEYTSEVFDSTMPMYSKKEQEHLNSPFYKKVDEITEKVKMQQIIKGAEKYPEPFNPASWTGEQLVNHGLQEARDLQVYLVGLAEHIERIEEENRALRCLVEEYKSTFERLEKENESLKDENRKLTEIIDLHELNGKDSVNVIERLEEELLEARAELKRWKLSHG